MQPANESISCTADARRGDAACGPVSNCDVTLSAVAATLNAVQRRGEELARRVATANAAVDHPPTVEKCDGTPNKSLPSDDNQGLRPPIAVIETDDLASLSPLSTPDGSVGTAVPTTAQLTPMSLSADTVDPCSMDRTSMEDECVDTEPRMKFSNSSAAELTVKKAMPTSTRQFGEEKHDASDCIRRRLQTGMLAPPSALEVSALRSRRGVMDAGSGGEVSTLCNSDEDPRQTVIRVDTASATAPVDVRVNGRFVTFFNFTSKQRAMPSTGADRKLKRAVRRERRATKTLAIVLGN